MSSSTSFSSTSLPSEIYESTCSNGSSPLTSSNSESSFSFSETSKSSSSVTVSFSSVPSSILSDFSRYPVSNSTPPVISVSLLISVSSNEFSSSTITTSVVPNPLFSTCSPLSSPDSIHGPASFSTCISSSPGTTEDSEPLLEFSSDTLYSIEAEASDISIILLGRIVISPVILLSTRMVAVFSSFELLVNRKINSSEPLGSYISIKRTASDGVTISYTSISEAKSFSISTSASSPRHTNMRRLTSESLLSSISTFNSYRLPSAFKSELYSSADIPSNPEANTSVSKGPSTIAS